MAILCSFNFIIDSLISLFAFFQIRVAILKYYFLFEISCGWSFLREEASPLLVVGVVRKHGVVPPDHSLVAHAFERVVPFDEIVSPEGIDGDHFIDVSVKVKPEHAFVQDHRPVADSRKARLIFPFAVKILIEVVIIVGELEPNLPRGVFLALADFLNLVKQPLLFVRVLIENDDLGRLVSPSRHPVVVVVAFSNGLRSECELPRSSHLVELAKHRIVCVRAQHEAKKHESR